MRLKRLTYLPKATRLMDGRTCIWIYNLRLNYQALISVLLTTSLAPYCFKAERGPWKSVVMFQGPPADPWLPALLDDWPRSSTGYSSFQPPVGLWGWRVQARERRKEGAQGFFFQSSSWASCTPISFWVQSLSCLPGLGVITCLNSPEHCTASGFLISLPIDW